MSEYTCPHCKNPIYDDEALLCHFCGDSLNRASKGAMGKMRYGKPKTIWIAVTMIALIAFILLFVR